MENPLTAVKIVEDSPRYRLAKTTTIPRLYFHSVCVVVNIRTDGSNPRPATPQALNNGREFFPLTREVIYTHGRT